MNGNTWLTMAALDRGIFPSMEEVFANVRSTAPRLVEKAGVTEIRTAGHVATCRWGESVVGVTLVDRPIPASALEGPCANAWYWPGAAQVVAQHTHHLLINLVDESRDPIETALGLTALTSAAARAAAAIAVVWAPAGLIHEPHAFAEQAQQSSRASLPLYLWVDFRVRQHPNGLVDAFTTGLARFGKREIELAPVEATTQQALEWAYNVSHYVLDHAAAIKDGDTVGLSDGTEFTVEHAKSRVDAKTEVLLLKPAPQTSEEN